MSDYEQRLQALVGRQLGETQHAPDEVNVPMIRHWVEAMGNSSPVHLDPEAAKASGRDEVVAPATMVQAFTMRGYAATVDPPQPSGTVEEMSALLEEGGYTSVVATDSEYEFERELVPGDRLTVTETIESISDEKRTGLGTGRFVTSLRTYRDQDEQVVATQRWRLLRFRPPSAEQPAAGTADGEGETVPGTRARPAINRDNAFWFEAAADKRLVIQRCGDCQRLRHPPMPACPHCQSLEWDTIEPSGRGTIYSYVVAHHPKIPGFTYPHIVALVELEEGVRLLADVLDLTREQIEIGMPVELDWIQPDEDLTLPAFRPAETKQS